MMWQQPGGTRPRFAADGCRMVGRFNVSKHESVGAQHESSQPCVLSSRCVVLKPHMPCDNFLWRSLSPMLRANSLWRSLEARIIICMHVWLC